MPVIMTTFIRSHSGIIIALSTGLVIGTGATILIQKLNRNLSREIAALAARIESLKSEVTELKGAVQRQLSSAKQRRRGYYSVHASSGEEDDEFEEACGGSESEFTLEPRSPTTTSDEYFTATSGSSENGSGPSDPQNLYNRVDVLLEGTDEDKEEAYKILAQREKKLAKRVDFLWRFAKATYLKSGIEGSRGNMDAKKDLVYAAKELAIKAEQTDDKNAEVQKWCAITIGSIGDYEPTNVRILNGFKFKEYIEKSIDLNPTDSSAHYLLGRWCFGVYMLSWVERKLAATLFATPPSATVDQALGCFMKADELSSENWKDNCLFIAKCHIEKRDYPSAVQWLDKADALPADTADDKVSQEEVSSLLKKYNYYRRS